MGMVAFERVESIGCSATGPAPSNASSKVMPPDYKRVLDERAARESEGNCAPSQRESMRHAFGLPSVGECRKATVLSAQVAAEVPGAQRLSGRGSEQESRRGLRSRRRSVPGVGLGPVPALGEAPGHGPTRTRTALDVPPTMRNC